MKNELKYNSEKVASGYGWMDGKVVINNTMKTKKDEDDEQKKISKDCVKDE